MGRVESASGESTTSSQFINKKRRHLISEKLEVCGEKSTIHGVPFYIRAERIPVKIMWGVIILASTGYCAYSVVASFMSYLKYEVDTNVEILRDSDAQFPAVSICILQVCDLDNNKEYKSYFSRMIQDDFNSSGKLTDEELNGIMKTYNLKTLIIKSRDYFIENYNKEDLKKHFASNKTSIRWNLISCQYSSEYCFDHDFEFFKINDFQRCYKFNGRKNFNGDEVEIKKARRYLSKNMKFDYKKRISPLKTSFL